MLYAANKLISDSFIERKQSITAENLSLFSILIFDPLPNSFNVQILGVLLFGSCPQEIRLKDTEPFQSSNQNWLARALGRTCLPAYLRLSK